MPSAKSFRNRLLRIPPVLFGLILLLLTPACKKDVITRHEYMYVSAQETSLRDKVATMYAKVGTVHNGDRVEVLEKQRRFSRVRTDAGLEGWMEQRSLVSQEVYDGFQQLAKESSNVPIQAHGTTRAELNMHLTPSREGEHLYQLKDGEKLEILKRTTTDKNAPKTPPATPAPKAVQATPPANQSSAAATKPAPAASNAPAQPSAPAANAPEAKPPEPPKPIMEDWYLVRSPSGHVGWVLLRMVDLDVPLDVAQYAEGQRIVAYFVLNMVQEDDQQVPQYLVLLNQPKDGLPWDFNQIRVFTRNRAKHRYETAYREREIEGYLPASVSHQVFDKEGDLPTFTIRKKNADGQVVENTYKLNGPIVRRVLTPEEEAAAKAKHDADLAARQQANAQARAKRSSSHAKQGKKGTSSQHHQKHR